MFNRAAKRAVEKTSQVNRAFGYVKGGITLNFTLRTDTKDQLQAFLELLDAAMADVQEELSKQ